MCLIIQGFKAFVENQIEKKIKTIKCDDGGGI
jgi:hypothetical protein